MIAGRVRNVYFMVGIGNVPGATALPPSPAQPIRSVQCFYTRTDYRAGCRQSLLIKLANCTEEENVRVHAFFMSGTSFYVHHGYRLHKLKLQYAAYATNPLRVACDRYLQISD